MISLQILNKVLNTKNIELIKQNNLEEAHFIGYEDEYNFIINHFKRYKKVPDLESFINEFKDFESFEVSEADDFLIDKVNEEFLYYKSVPILQEMAEYLKEDSRKAVDFLIKSLSELKVTGNIKGIDIIKDAELRYKEYLDKTKDSKKHFIPTGFEELDSIIKGWARTEEYAVIFARTGQGKSWVLIKMMANCWQLGYKVGYISPEMSPSKIGYRFDTSLNNFSNQNLNWGNKVDEKYFNYIEKLKAEKINFIVATPMDFGKKITVSKIRSFCQIYKLDILAVDGITYMTDERHNKGDTKTISLTNISEDLISLSLELNIPIIVAVQSNRGGVKSNKEEGTPDLEHIRDSDGIAQNATKVISLRQSGTGIEFGVKKHRDGISGTKLLYYWDIDKGIFDYIPSYDDDVDTDVKNKKIEDIKTTYKDKKEVIF